MNRRDGSATWPFGRVAFTLSLLGPGFLIAVMLWPHPPFDPDGVPSQALGGVVVLMYTAMAMVGLAFLGLITGTVSVARREARRYWVLGAMALDGVVLSGLLALLLRSA